MSHEHITAEDKNSLPQLLLLPTYVHGTDACNTKINQHIWYTGCTQKSITHNSVFKIYVKKMQFTHTHVNSDIAHTKQQV